MKKTWLLLLVFPLFMGYSCKQKDKDKKDIVIAIIPKLDNEIFDHVKKSAFQTAKELGIVVTWEAPTSSDGEKQKELIDNLIQYKVDGILISCNDEEALRGSINKAMKAGIKVGTFDSDSPKSSRIFYVGTDNTKAGKICAETMLALYKKANLTPDQIIVLSGGASAQNMIERISGFRAGLSKGNIADILYSFEIPEYGTDLLSTNLRNNKKINGVQMIWGVPVLNGLDSIPALSDFMKNGGISVFFDVSKPLLFYIKNNPNCATMKQDFEAMGQAGVTNLYNAIVGEPYKSEILYNVKVIDQSNVEKEIADL